MLPDVITPRYRKHESVVVIDPDAGCWLWQRSRNGAGYGVVRRGGKTLYCHVLCWESVNGPVPEGMELDHVVCQNKQCCNPGHLEPVTHAANCQRALGRVNHEIAQRIRDERKFLSVIRLAEKLGVSRGCVYAIIHGRTWIS